MKVKKHNNITKIILLFSFILIFTGLFIYISDEKKYQENNNSQEIVYNPPPDNIKIDDTSKNTDASKSSPTTEEKKPAQNKPEPQKEEILEKNTPLSIEQRNDRQRSILETTYDIAIRYGEETRDYTIGGMGTTTIDDPQVIKGVLDELETSLELYPDGFFREFSKKGLYLTIYLIDKYTTDNVTGVTDPRTNNVTISIATAYPFEDSFHHEVFHYIERYIKLNGGTFNSWEVFNPSNFVYGQENLDYSYANTLAVDSYFVNSYAETAADEDRASTFEYMMSNRKALFFEKDTPIMNKAKYIADVVDLFFTTVNSSTVEYWERYL